MLETKRVKGIIKLGNTSTDNEMIMSHKQGELYTIISVCAYLNLLLIVRSEKVSGEWIIIGFALESRYYIRPESSLYGAPGQFKWQELGA